jgi:hypothetical protein
MVDKPPKVSEDKAGYGARFYPKIPCAAKNTVWAGGA